MNSPVNSSGPTLPELFGLFTPVADIPAFEVIPGESMPIPYRDLLVHQHHMTVTVEAFHGDRVNVRILDRRHEGDHYSRKILLTLQQTGRVVQFGIVRVDLRCLPAKAREQIVAGQTPFGRVLIDHDVLRRIEPTAYLRVTPSAAMCGWFGLPAPQPLYGRLALIHCDGVAAVELLEIVAP